MTEENPRTIRAVRHKQTIKQTALLGIAAGSAAVTTTQIFYQELAAEPGAGLFVVLIPLAFTIVAGFVLARLLKTGDPMTKREKRAIWIALAFVALLPFIIVASMVYQV